MEYMKKNLFYLFMLMAVVAMPLTSCEKNNEPQAEEEKQHDPNSDADQIAIVGFDGLDYLQGCLLVVDEEGQLLRRVIGDSLDESQPTVISVPVADYAAAENLFLTWVAPGKADSDIVEHESGYDYNLTDAEGNAQGSVSFNSVENEDGVVARMTVNENTDLKQVTEVNFINSELWPENDIVEYKAGQVYELEDYVMTWGDSFKAEKQNLPFYCIQGTSSSSYGILVWISPDENTSAQHPYAAQYIANAQPYLPTMLEVYQVLAIHTTQNDMWNNMLKEMDAEGYKWSPQSGSKTTGTSEFMIGDVNKAANQIYCLDLDTTPGSITVVGGRSLNMYRYMHIKLIPPYSK